MSAASHGKSFQFDLACRRTFPVVARARRPLALRVRWGEEDARLSIDGKPAPWGTKYRAGRVHHLDGTDLVIWMERKSSQPMQIEISPAR